MSDGAVFPDGVDAGTLHAHVGQDHVHHGEDAACNETADHGVVDHAFLFLHTEGSQCGGNDQSKVQRSNGIHGLIAVHKALHEGGLLIGGLSRGNGSLALVHEEAEEHHDQHQQRGGQEFAHPLHQFLGGQAQPQDNEEEYEGVSQHPQLHGSAGGEIGSHRHLKGDGSRSGNAQSGSNGEVDQNGEDKGKTLAHQW